MGKRNQSIIKDAIIVASRLPWWINILLAITCYYVLNYFATLQNQPVDGINNLGQFGTNQVMITLASFGKLLVPFIFTIGAFASFFKRTKRKRLYASVVKTGPVRRNNYDVAIDSFFDRIKRKCLPCSDVNMIPVDSWNNDFASQYDPINTMSWQNFETLVSEFFKEQGYTVIDCGGGCADGGVDILLKKGGKKTIVQCKHWKTYKVGVTIVREQFGIMTAGGFDEAIIVTSGNYTYEAKEFAKNNNITLITGDRL